MIENWHQIWHTNVMLLRISLYRPRKQPIKMIRLIIAIALILFPFIGISSELDKTNSLFSSTTPIEIILQMDMEKVFNDKGKDPQYSPALLIQKIDEKNIQIFNIKIKARGNTRRISNICEFPPLKINFEKKSTKNTVFDGQDKVKVVTHCNESDEYQNYALLEYLSYKTYNTLTDYSYRVRIVNVVYKDIRQNYPDIIKSGFMIEDDDILAKRVGGKISDKRIWSPDSCENKAVEIFSLFQFMIGNTDWWIHTRHNVDLISLSDESLIPIPFDFDGAGIINTPYAMPSRQLPIITVKDRFFKSTCKTLNYYDYEETINQFNLKKDMILSMLDNALFLDKKYRKRAKNYIDDFYDIINDADKFGKYISQNCDFVNTPQYKVPSSN